MAEASMQTQTIDVPRLRSGVSKRQAIVSHLQAALLGQLYRLLPGSLRMPAGLFRRAVASGLKADVLRNLCQKAKSQADLALILFAAGETHIQRGLYWHDVGVKTRACDHYLESSLYYLYASMMSNEPLLTARASARCHSSYLLAAPQFAVPAELVAIPYAAGHISGYLRLPARRVEGEDNASYIASNFPCAVLFNSLNAAKEELHFMENTFLAHGIGTLSFDYPGLCCYDDVPTAFNFPLDEVVHSLIMFLASRPEIDMSRLSLFGTSLGGRFALCAAAIFPERFRAVASVSAPLDLLSHLQLLLPAMQKEMSVSEDWSRAAFFDLARCTPLRPMLEKMRTPLLVVGGSSDAIATAEETRMIFEECGATDKKMMICNRAKHNCYEMMPSLRHELASWMKQRL